jgi:hypothetical protein
MLRTSACTNSCMELQLSVLLLQICFQDKATYGHLQVEKQ